MERPCLYVVEDDAILMRLVRRVFEARGYDVFTFGDPQAFLDALEGLAAGCVLTDLCMPAFSGLELLQQIRERPCAWPVVLFSGRADIATAVEAMRLGASDFVEKPFRNDELVGSVDRALDSYALKREDQLGDQRAQALVKSLTPRQLELMRELAAGRSNKVIAYNLGISARTVEVHRARLMGRLQAGSLADVVRLAVWAQANMPAVFAGGAELRH